MAGKKKTSKKKALKAVTSTLKLGKKEEIVFRERRFRDIDLLPKHPAPTPGYKATLPGAPGWQYKENPGA